jgi:hypothetical protein
MTRDRPRASGSLVSTVRPEARNAGATRLSRLPIAWGVVGQSLGLGSGAGTAVASSAAVPDHSPLSPIHAMTAVANTSPAATSACAASSRATKSGNVAQPVTRSRAAATLA